MALIGYARVSTDDQTTAPQIDALNAAGCDRIFDEQASGALRARPQLAAALDYLRPGDTLVIVKLDRLGRSLHHLIEVVTGLDERKIGLKSLNESIDTNTSAGRLLLHVMGAIAQFERDLIIERTKAGLAAARARGRKGGRRTVMTADKLRVAQQMYDSKEYTLDAIARTVGVSRATLYRHLDDNQRPRAGAEAK